MAPASRAFLQSLTSAPDAGILVWLDKRKSPRVQYCATLPVNAGQSEQVKVPQAAAFESVETRDLSQSGVSFYSQHAPDEPTVVIQLGESAVPIYMLARIVRCEKDYEDAQRRFIIGCEFVGQLKG